MSTTPGLEMAPCPSKEGAHPLVPQRGPVEEGAVDKFGEAADDGDEKGLEDSLDNEFLKHYVRAKKLGGVRSSAPGTLGGGGVPQNRYSTNSTLLAGIESQDVCKTFEFWFPSANKFKFSYTISYWVAVLSLKGSILMLFVALVGYFDPEKKYPGTVKNLCTLVLCTIFLLSCWFQWIQVINVATKERRYFIPESWTEGIPNTESVVGAAAYFLAMMVWTCGAIFETLPHEYKPDVIETFFSFTSFCGAIGFTIGGLCECLHSRSVTSLTEVVVWVSVLDLLGGLHLMIYTFILLIGNPESLKMVGRFNYLCAGTDYTIASALMLVMWQADDFGLALLGQINDAINATKVQTKSSDAGVVNVNLPQFIALVDGKRKSAMDKENRKLSLRGAAFLWTYCCLFCLVFINCLHSMFSLNYEYLDWPRDLVMLSVVVISLLVHSGLPHAPNVQPFRAALFALRAIFFLATLMHAIILKYSIRDVWGIGAH